jgi:hypothetical protein
MEIRMSVSFLRGPAVLAHPDGEPGGKPRDVGGEEALARDRHSHVKNAAQQNGIGRLRPGAVYGCNLDGEIVDNLLYAARKVRCRLALYFKVAGYHL